jgi:hypothetical protein
MVWRNKTYKKDFSTNYWKNGTSEHSCAAWYGKENTKEGFINKLSAGWDIQTL